MTLNTVNTEVSRASAKLERKEEVTQKDGTSPRRGKTCSCALDQTKSIIFPREKRTASAHPPAMTNQPPAVPQVPDVDRQSQKKV